MKRFEVSLDVMRHNSCVRSCLAEAHAEFVETTRAIVLDWLRFNQKQVEQQFSPDYASRVSFFARQAS